MKPLTIAKVALATIFVIGFLSFQRSLSSGKSEQQVGFERWLKAPAATGAVTLIVTGQTESGPFEWRLTGNRDEPRVERALELATTARLFDATSKTTDKPTATFASIEFIDGEKRFKTEISGREVEKNTRIQTFLRLFREYANDSLTQIAQTEPKAKKR